MPDKQTDGREHGRGAFLWSSMYPKNDLPLWQRVLLLPLYLADHGYHCLRGTPVYIQYGDHELRYDNMDTEHQGDESDA